MHSVEPSWRYDVSKKKVYEDKDKIIYEDKDDGWFLPSGAVEYQARDKHTGATSKGKSVGEARANLESGKSKK